MYHRLKKKVPLGWGVDENGNSTQDAAKILFGGGGLSPLGGLSEISGGHKG